jgi:hypothetical protein
LLVNHHLAAAKSGDKGKRQQIVHMSAKMS